MFRAIGFLIWTACCIAFGVWIASAKIGNATAAQQLSRLWTQVPLEKPLERIEEKVDDAKDALSTVHDHQVRERHSEADKDALNKLIAKRTAPK
jgi:hypothetical protein